jgi:ectoine hydroxylase-related dioxygenase (phytanoyl-CoA dioxygenase family)
VTYQQIDLAPDRDRRNVYNSPITRVLPKQDDIILFSSRLTHMVEPNTTGQPRHAIAFNTFVKGKLGQYRDVSELTLWCSGMGRGGHA